MPEEREDNRRENFRIVDILHMRDELLSEDEYEARKEHLGMPSRMSSSLRKMLPQNVDVEHLLEHGDVSGELVRAIESLDNKLNYLISVNMLNEAERHQLKERTVDISTMGMSFFTDRAYQMGQFVQVDMVVPTSPPQMMELLGEVKWVKQEDGRARIGVVFCFRNVEERDCVARYVFRRHREMIRLQEGESSSEA